MKISVVVHPNSRKPRIEKDLLETIHVYISEPPLEGKANKAVIKKISEFFDVRKTDVRILSGETSKYKTMEIASK